MHHELEKLKSLLLEVGHGRNPAVTLHRLCTGLAAIEGVALARLWLIEPGDICASCPMRGECPSQTRCLHLVASAGSSVADPDADWSTIDGAFRRFPLGVRKIGHIAESGTALHIEDVRDDSAWIARPEWIRAEGIRAFAGHPVTHHGKTLGVLGVFLRTPLIDESADWLRMLAQQIGASIANARAFAMDAPICCANMRNQSALSSTSGVRRNTPSTPRVSP
jgi:GAF domain-containing protein